MALNEKSMLRRAGGSIWSAKRRQAEDSRCPNYHRGNAIRTDRDSWDDIDATVYVTIRECRWRDRGLCDYKEVAEHRVPAA